jgi:hypothetical protein
VKRDRSPSAVGKGGKPGERSELCAPQLVPYKYLSRFVMPKTSRLRRFQRGRAKLAPLASLTTLPNFGS